VNHPSAGSGDPPGTTPGYLLGPADVRELAERLGVRPTKQLGQNFVIDANTIRRIVRTAELRPDDTVLEVGPGLGSLTLELLMTAAHVTAVEIDPVLAAARPETVARRAPEAAPRLRVVHADALTLTELPGPAPTALVANLPYNVAVPVLLHALETRWYGDVRRAGAVGRAVFWPAPNVGSGLVALDRRDPPVTSAARADVFAVIDAAFAQRRKTLRAALAGWAGGPVAAERVLRAADVDPGARGEQLDVGQFARVAAAKKKDIETA
jgi:16S rRNA (adenine1518-N6/adenine1519-N6)-dimethyltransferase